MLVPYVTFDVFTEERFGGNPLAVVMDAIGLETPTMQAIAREFGYSETTFVLPPDDPAHAAKVRIFTPAAEIPFAGHPTIGTALAIARIETDWISPTDRARPMVLEEGIGPVPVVVRATGSPGLADFAVFTAAKLPESGPTAGDTDIVATAAGLSASDLIEPISAWSAGIPFTILPIKSLDRLRAAAPDHQRFKTSLSGAWAEALLLVCMESEATDADLQVRMFAPTLGVTEDPATGSAAAALAGWLCVGHGRGDGEHSVRIAQGLEMGRSSRIHLTFAVDNGRLRRVRIGGHAVKVMEGMLHVPD